MARSELQRLIDALGAANEDLMDALNNDDGTKRAAKNIHDLEDAIDELDEKIKKLKNTSEALKSIGELSEKLGEFGEGISEAAGYLESFKGTVDALGGIADKAFSVLEAGWDKVSSLVSKATENNTAYFESLNNIIGLNGQLGQFGNTLRDISSGTVGKADLSSFFGSTGSLFQNAEAMGQMAGFARDLVAAYGSASAGAQKFQNILLLSEESQEAMVGLVQQQAKVVEQSSAGQLKALKVQSQEAMDSIGASLLYSVKPVLEFMSQIAEALADVAGLKALDDQSDALAKNLHLTEEQKEAARELNELELLRAQGFTSSLDEVHEIGSAYLEEKNSLQEVIDTETAGEAAKQSAMEGTSQKAKKVAESLYSVVEVVKSLGESFADFFAFAGPSLLSFGAGILKIVTNVMNWLAQTRLLLPVLGTMIGVLGALKVAQAAFAVAVGIAKVAEAGIAAPAVAASILGGVVSVGAGIGAVAGIVGAGISTAGGSSGGNAYGGMANDLSNAKVSVYLDGKKVNDELAYEKSLRTEVVIR